MDSIMTDGVVKLVQGVGLPAVFCFWLMFRVEKRLDEQTTVLREIGNAMTSTLEHVRKED